MVREELVKAGRGNPRLMEALNTLLEVENIDVTALLQEVKGKQEEFVQELVLREILKRQPVLFQKVLQYQSVYRLPVLKEGIELVCKGITGWDSYVKKGVQLSLIEEGKDKAYWVTPLLREEIFEELSEDEKVMCHQGAVMYYQHGLSAHFEPVYAFELIDHALECSMNETAIGVGGVLLLFLRENLLYTEAVYAGVNILSHIPESEFKRDEKSSRFFYEFGWILKDVGEYKKAIKYYEQALSIDKEVYGERHPAVATRLNNLGQAWADLGEYKKAIKYYERALSIDKEVYGERHPAVATDLNNLGSAWADLGEYKKAIEYYEQALSIGKEVYGERHPAVATDLNNLGLAWADLGEYKKGIEYIQKAYTILQEMFGDQHPKTKMVKENLDILKDKIK